MLCYNNLLLYIPECLLFAGLVVNLTLSFIQKKSLNKLGTITVFITLILSLFSLVVAQVCSYNLFSHVFKILVCVSSTLVLILQTKKIYLGNSFYFNIFFLSSVLFLMMIINSQNYLNLYINIEFFSISIYFLMSMDKLKLSYSETLKYFILSTLASLFVLLGVAYLYGVTSSISFQEIADYTNDNQNNSLSAYLVPYIFIVSGLMFKLGGLPFGKWVIDIYKNIDTRIVAFISVTPKLAIFVALSKILGSFLTFETSFIMIILALFTGFFGVIYGFAKTKLKEIMAASSYINISYMLIALAIYTKISIATLIFYWLAYIFMNIGGFAGIIALEHSNLMNKCRDFRGYFYKNPLFTSALGICFLSLLGIPISSGFVAKIYLLAGVLNSGIIVLPVIFIMLIIMILSVCVYIKPIKDMFIILPYNKNYVIKTKSANKIILYVCTFITVIIGLFPAFFIKICETISLYQG